MNDTAEYRMNPAEDTLVYGEDLKEGMWVLASSPEMRRPHERDEDSLLRRQRFRHVTRLRRTPGSGSAPAKVVFVAEWVDGYQEEHSYAVTYSWIAKKAPEDPAAAEAAQAIARVCLNGYSEHVRLHGPDGDKATEDGTGEARFTVEREGRLYDVTVTPRAEGGS